jgi:hypothetical protein
MRNNFFQNRQIAADKKKSIKKTCMCIDDLLPINQLLFRLYHTGSLTTQLYESVENIEIQLRRR